MEFSDDDEVSLPSTQTRLTPRSGSAGSRGKKHRPRPPPKVAAPPPKEKANVQGGGSRPGTAGRPGKKEGPMSARNRFNFASLSRRDNIIFGAERPGYVRPNPDQPSTPRGPLVPVPVVEQWCQEMKSKGIKRVLTLLNENEMSFYQEPLTSTFALYFAEVVTLPQNSSATLHAVLDAMKAAEDCNEPIVVHCSTGQGRTGTILALWLHHRYSLPIPAAVTECMEYASVNGAVRKPSIEALMQLLLGSAQRILPHIRNMQPEREGGGVRGQTPRMSPGISAPSTGNTPSATPRLDQKLHITFLQTGGTIDKDYPKSKGGYSFEITDPAVERIIKNVDCAFSYDIKTVCKKDSQQMTNEDREKMVEAIEKSDSMRFIVTHGSDTLIETAKYLDRSGLSVGKVVIVTGAMRPEHFRNSDAHFNVGVAMGAINVLWSGVYVAMNGRVVEASRAQRDQRTGLFAVR
ncbi:hypothetical protein TrST_g13261 [Triparma strigata]|uniref:Tyrosine specific protein phosphatases domain-containing protein n=1 Tax=Triparma strigata TaxID=1606541 RepID=A0A9W7AGJ7_9STRA|nr:hypothetical protein TrST_g13261 [Triparma strigata]